MWVGGLGAVSLAWLGTRQLSILISHFPISDLPILPIGQTQVESRGLGWVGVAVHKLPSQYTARWRMNPNMYMDNNPQLPTLTFENQEI